MEPPNFLRLILELLSSLRLGQESHNSLHPSLLVEPLGAIHFVFTWNRQSPCTLALSRNSIHLNLKLPIALSPLDSRAPCAAYKGIPASNLLRRKSGSAPPGYG